MAEGEFRLDGWIVWPRRRTIERDGNFIQVKPKSMSVLECLVMAAGEPVSRTALLDAVWPGAEVSDDVLTQCIVELRRAFGDDARNPRVIETIPRFGFRLVLSPEPLEGEQLPRGPSTSLNTPPHSRWPRSQSVWLSLLLLTLLSGALLFSSTIRLWLTETGVTLYLKAAAFIAPHTMQQKPGIAVLPFMNFSGDPENEYFSDGISVEVINALARANRLPVVAQSSSFEFKGRHHNVIEIGHFLGVTYLLEGSVRRENDNIRLTVQLIDTTRGAHVWSDVYQRRLGEIFVLQNEIATEIVNQIYKAVGEEITEPLEQAPSRRVTFDRRTSDLAAYESYLQGMQLLRSSNPIPSEESVGYFEQAIALDPDYADAWAAKGLALYSLGRPGDGHPHIPAEVYPDAIAAFRRALELEPDHALATGWLGATVIANDFRWAEGMRMMEKSLAMNPNDADLWSVYALHLRFMKLDGADEALYTAFRLDPYGIVPVKIRIGGLQEEGRILEAASLMDLILRKDSEGYSANYQNAVLNIQMHRFNAAELNIQKARQVAHPDDLSLDTLEWVIAELRGEGSAPSSHELLRRMQQERISFLLDRDMMLDWPDKETAVAVHELAIKQRLPEVRRNMFGPKPDIVPEQDWRRMQEITGVTQFQASR